MVEYKNQNQQTKTLPHPSNQDLQNHHSWSKIQPGSGQCPVKLIHDQQSGRFLACCFKLDSEHQKKRESIIDLIKIIVDSHNNVRKAETNSKTRSGTMVGSNGRFDNYKKMRTIYAVKIGLFSKMC